MNCRTLLRQSINRNSAIFPCLTCGTGRYLVLYNQQIYMEAQTRQNANLWIVRQVISQPLHSRTFCTVAIDQVGACLPGLILVVTPQCHTFYS